MKTIKFIIGCALISQSLTAQYYYKDILLTKESTAKLKLYKTNGVKAVRISSFESNGQPTEGFTCEQSVARAYSEIATHTKSNLSSESLFTAFYDNNGMIRNTIDTTDRFQSTTEYTFDGEGRLITVLNTSTATDTKLSDIERHEWKYNSAGVPVQMLKIKNGNDTTVINFVTDEKGNVVEERAVRKKLAIPAVYYYYDDSNRLTDVVRYNNKAKRLLPDYVFDYAESGSVHSMLTVPEDNNGYQKWIYDYDVKGLRVRESCYDRQKQLMGKLEYSYSFSR